MFFEGTLADLRPTCMWTFLINTFRFSIGLFVLKKRERGETWHPGRVGIRSKVWHATQWNHRYSPAFHLLFSLSSPAYPSSFMLLHTHTLLAGLQQTVSHIHHCLFCAGVVTSLDNAALCLFFRLSSFYTLWIQARMWEHTELFVSFIHANNWSLCEAVHVSQLDRFIVCAFLSKTWKVFFLSFVQSLYRIQKSFSVSSLVEFWVLKLVCTLSAPKLFKMQCFRHRPLSDVKLETTSNDTQSTTNQKGVK